MVKLLLEFSGSAIPGAIVEWFQCDSKFVIKGHELQPLKLQH